MDNPAAPISPTPVQPAVGPEVFTPSESSNRRWVLWLIGGAALLGLGIAIGVFGAKFLNKSQSQSQLPTPSSAQSSTPTSDLYREPTGSAATAGWKTYTSSQYNFSFKYPAGWYPSEFPEHGLFIVLAPNRISELAPDGPTGPIEILTNQCTNTVTNQKYPCQTSISERLNSIKQQFTNESLSTNSNFMLDNKQGYQVSGYLTEGPLGGSYFKETAFPFTNGYLLTLVLYQKDQEETYNQILSTFHFLK